MNANLFSAIVDLPVEIQQMIVGGKVKKDRSINLTTANVQQEIRALVSPFAGRPDLLTLATTELLKVNTFAVYASMSTVTWNSGVPSIVSTATGQTLTKCPGIRHLEVVVHNTLQGADWNTPTPVVLPVSTTRLLQVLPTIFPKLDSVTFKVINVNLLAQGAVYTKNNTTRQADACPDSQSLEKASRMYQLMRAAHETVFALWKRNSPVQKSLLFVQSIPHAAAGKGPKVEVKSGPNSFRNTGNMGLSPNTKKRMWAFCDSPMARIVFV